MAHEKVHPDYSSESVFHVSPVPLNLAIFAALMMFTALTVWAAFQDFGAWDTPIAFMIAIIKATLVIMFFMHVKYSSKIVMLSAASGFIFLLLMITFPVADRSTRVPVEPWPRSVDTSPPFEAPPPPVEDQEREAVPGGV
ncbi:MAG: cytochrome C oxidase subunit IV family protein [Myxococcota bacterium]